jgi:choline dehydrogenase
MEFDFVIVGGGTAGCVLAHRLTADGRHSALLIEAGGSDRRFWIQVPIGYGRSFYDPGVNWKLMSEPEPGLAGRRLYWPRGKVLGGSSSINAMVFIRGHPGDFDEWEATGNPGWGWRDVLPYFKRLEDNARGADDWRAVGGPLAVSELARFAHPVCRSFIAAGVEAGYPLNDDFNGATMEGVGYYQITTRGGRRMSTARAYLDPARRRSGLAVELHALASRILFEAGRAIAVEFRQRGAIRTVRARREVIVAAGAVHSPLLLQASGIGPGPLLRQLAIPVVRHNPAVGANLQDHLSLDHIYRSKVATLNNELRPLAGKLVAGLKYLALRRGPLALSVNHAGGFVRSRPDLARPDIQLYFQPMSYTTVPAGRRPLMSPDPFPGFLMSIAPCRPFSRGAIRLRSPDLADPPLIVPGSLADERDLEALVTGFGLLRRLAAMPSLASVIAEEIAPGPAVISRADIIAFARAHAGSVFHASGTCRMGPEAGSSVVDNRLRVHGVDALRVVDASIFPNVTSGNTNAPVVMVAEKAADLILGKA